MAVDNALFSASDLRYFLDLTAEADANRTVIVERLTWGQIKPIIRPLLGSDGARPAALDDTIFAAALIIGAYLYDNPTAAQELVIGGETTKYVGGVIGDQLEILRGFVTDQADGAADGVPPPRGTFPPAPRYPDPARPNRVGWGRSGCW